MFDGSSGFVRALMWLFSANVVSIAMGQWSGSIWGGAHGRLVQMGLIAGRPRDGIRGAQLAGINCLRGCLMAYLRVWSASTLLISAHT